MRLLILVLRLTCLNLKTSVVHLFCIDDQGFKILLISNYTNDSILQRKTGAALVWHKLYNYFKFVLEKTRQISAAYKWLKLKEPDNLTIGSFVSILQYPNTCYRSRPTLNNYRIRKFNAVVDALKQIKYLFFVGF